MNQYEKLLDEAQAESIAVVEKKLKSKALGLCKGNTIAIRKGLPLKTKVCVLAEEIAHSKLTVGNITDQRKTENRKQEYKSRKYSAEKVIPLNHIIDAYLSGCRNYYMVAEYLEIDEQFLKEAIEIYRKKYGVYAIIDNYVVYFEPTLCILEMI